MRKPTIASLIAGAAVLALSLSKSQLPVRAMGAAAAAQGEPADARRKPYDELLDTNVRDGMVYYRALKGERARLDGYVGALGAASIESASREAQIAFWINAYNAIVLQTVVEHYPIVQRTKEYPARSIRQIPGAFERLTHRVAGRMVTLDQIEQQILSGYQDPRVFFALGRGAIGGGRLRSEAFTPEGLDHQLTEAANECVTRAQCFQTDQERNALRVSSIFSWRDKDFVAAYAGTAPAVFSERSPIERAAVAFLGPRLLPAERSFVDKNNFKMEYIPFDWSLNDLTGRGGR